MTTASPDVSEIDASARFPLSLLIASALWWLVVSGALALLSFGQTLSPSLLAECPAFSYGRLRGIQETVFIYGWVANSGVAAALWLLARLSGSPLRSLNWVTVGAVFWNLAIVLGVVGIALGEGSAFSLLRMPRDVQPLMLVAFCAMAVPGILSWTGRARPRTFAAQWYAVAALFLFPWLFSAAQVMIEWVPLRGVLQAVAAGWFVQSAWTLWMAPLALAVAYYLVPKISGRLIPSYDFASLSFWTLLVVGGWTGGRHLIGGPVPAWIPTMAIVSCTLLTFHYLVTALNLRIAFGQRSLALKFIGFGVAAYVVGGFADAVTAMRTVAVATQFTWVAAAQSQLALSGGFSMILFGAFYFMAPRILNKAWPSTSLIRAHYAAAMLGVVVLVIGLAAAGLVQGRDLNNAAVSFADVAHHTSPWIQVAAAGQALLLFGNLLFGIHFARLLLVKPAASSAQLFRQPSTMEASVS